MFFSRTAKVSAGAALGAAIFIGIGCSNDVVTQDGSGGAHSTSSSSATNATSTKSTSVGTTAVTSASTGAGTACDQACTKATGCGFDICSMLALDCGSPVQACAADCINGASCAAIQTLKTTMPDPGLGACLFACQQSAQTTGAGGGMNMGCTQCVQQHNCIPMSCFQNNDCTAWLQCAGGCNNQGPNCYTNCDAQHPAAKTFYDQIYSCSCTSCSTQCAGQDPCSHVPPGTTGSVGSTGSGM